MKIGLVVIATNKYIQFVDPLYDSMCKHFLPNHEVTMFLFTNKNSLEYNPREKMVCVPQQHIPWPGTTLFRYNIFHHNKDILQNMDYLYYSDADMLFVDTVGDEVLGELVGTQHPGFFDKPRWYFSYETNPKSLACVNSQDGQIYFAGGFNGGTSKSYLKMCNVLQNNINVDMSNGIIAKWHDESHMNRYFIDNPPTNILSPSYCYPESANIPFKPKLLALDKNHNDVRT